MSLQALEARGSLCSKGERGEYICELGSGGPFSTRQLPYRTSEIWRIYLLRCCGRVTEVGFRVFSGSASEGSVKARLLKIRCAVMMGQELIFLARPRHDSNACDHRLDNHPERCMKHRYGHVLLKPMANNVVHMPIPFAADAPYAPLFHHRGYHYLSRGRTDGQGLPLWVDIWKYSMDPRANIATMLRQLADELQMKMSKAELFRLETDADYVCFSRWVDSEVLIFYHLVTDAWKQ